MKYIKYVLALIFCFLLASCDPDPVSGHYFELTGVKLNFEKESCNVNDKIRIDLSLLSDFEKFSSYKFQIIIRKTGKSEIEHNVFCLNDSVNLTENYAENGVRLTESDVSSEKEIVKSFYFIPLQEGNYSVKMYITGLGTGDVYNFMQKFDLYVAK